MNHTKTTPDRRERRKLETRARIEDAAYDLFKMHGIESTSIEMICQQADVARRTFYSHFPNKHALLGGLGISRLYNQAEPMMRTIMEEHDSTATRLDAMIDFIESCFAAFEEIDRQLILSAPATVASDPSHQRQINNTAVDSFRRLIAAGQASGDAGGKFSAEILALMIVGTLNALTTNWAIDPDYPIMERLEEARVMFKVSVCSSD